MKRNKKTKWESEFAEFLIAEPVEVPTYLSNKVLNQIHEELNPSSLAVFIKLSFIHFIVGFVTLLFCPQFGVSVTSQLGLMPYLMRFGHEVCTFACGSIFVGTSILISTFYLNPEEIKVLRHYGFLQFLALATLSIGFFVAFGAEIVLSLGLIWLAGATLGGVLTLDMGWAFRRRFLFKVAK